MGSHDFIELTLSIKNPQPPPKTITTRNLRNINHTALHEQLMNHLPSAVIQSSNPTDTDTLKSSLSSAITSAFDLVAPQNTITIRSKDKPWATPEIKSLMKDTEKNSNYLKAQITSN